MKLFILADTLLVARQAIRVAWSGICLHESRHRGGVIWEICDDCGAKWTDDEGGFKPSARVTELTRLENELSRLELIAAQINHRNES